MDMHWPVICQFNEVEMLALAAKQDGRTREIVTLNPEILFSTYAERDKSLFFAQSAVMTIDSFSLMMVLKASGLKVGRYTGVDLVAECFKRCSKTSTFLLYGGKPGVAAQVAQQSSLLHVTSFDGYNYSAKDVCDHWNKDQPPPDFCFVGLGGIKQYEATRYIAQEIRPRIIVACGGAFDVLSGTLPRAPMWMRNIGLEWLFRLMQQPERIVRQANVLRGLALIGSYYRAYNHSNIQIGQE
jgi:N-acetylglucosaminyldiphosphoundecaprenol N-acetyl-beta-D-mannosaminyltransferase